VTAVRTPVRIVEALDRPGWTAVVLRRDSREAFEAMREDFRLLAEIIGEMPPGFVRVEISHRRLTLANGSTIEYKGGREPELEEWCRGRQADRIDGAMRLPYALCQQLLARGVRL
jgi:hypothetical protein